jgi:hypothetical protein
VYDRFEAVNLAVRAYFAPYFRLDLATIERRPVKDFATAPVGAFAALEFLPGVAPTDVPPQVLVDYEAIRIPMVSGAPTLRPEETRNPARGIMNLQRPVVLALCDVGGLRWGASDFGPSSSGDMMHFDTSSRILA